MATDEHLIPLSGLELVRLVERVFGPLPDERRVAFLVDLPDEARPDHSRWSARRSLAVDWAEALLRAAAGRFEVSVWWYPHVGANNADLPEQLWSVAGPPPSDARQLDPAGGTARDLVLADHPMILATTEMSATAPLKILARRIPFRAATMGGLRAAMIPALRLDLVEVDRRVRHLAQLLDQASGARLRFSSPHGDHELWLDLRHRIGHASSGLLRAPGSVGNLPSGEAYCVPYEGERAGDPSRSEGELPIQLGSDVALLRIRANRVLEVLDGGAEGLELARRIEDEPATANLAELGLGVLAELGIEPIGSTLLDEKLGLHVALGRSDHFGGAVGPADFRSPARVIHQDYVYVPATQPLVAAVAVDLEIDGQLLPLMRDNRYVVDFG